MILNFKYGFTYKELNFGWKDKKLYRLPSTKKLTIYPLKEVPQIEVGNKKGHRVCRDKKTIEQLMELTEVINYKYIINGKGSLDTPF
jgi:hypothetical protein